MNVRKLILLGITTLSASTLVGAGSCYDNACDPCDPCGMMDGLTVYADWIYWRTRRGDLDYAVSSGVLLGSEGEGHVHGVCPDWNSGFRVGLEKTCDCWVFGAEYTRYTNSSSSEYTGSVFGTRGIPALEPWDFAAGSYKIELNIVQVTLGSDVCWNECINARIYTGFKYASINQRFEAVLADANPFDGQVEFDATRTKSNVDAYGLTFGINPVYKVFDCLDLVGSFSVDAYAADSHKDWQFVSVSGSTFEEISANLVDHSDCWNLIGTINLGVGLTYVMENPCGCGDFALSVGYEFHEWINTPGFLSGSPIFVEGDLGPEVAGFNLDRHNSDLGFDGLFVRLAATF